MWYYFNKSKFYETEFNTTSNLLKNYFKSIDIVLHSAAKSEETDYEKNLKSLEDYFENSPKCSKKIRSFDEYLGKISLEERQKFKNIIKTNLEIKNYLKDYDSFISYKNLKDYGFSTEFTNILREMDNAFWEYLSSKDNGSVKKQYYEMLYNSLNGKIYCPFCGINRLKNPKEKGKLSPLEHFVPKAKYPFVAWNIDNIFLSCEDCNSKKGEKILQKKDSIFFPIELYTTPKIKLKLISYNLIDEEDISKNISNDNCIIEFIPENISKEDFDNYLSTWNHFFSIEDRLKENLISYVKKKEREFKRKKRKNKNFDFLTDIEVELEEAEKDGNIIKIAYLKYKEDELKDI